MENSAIGGDVFFILMGAILVFAMHAGFCFWKWARYARKTKSMQWSKSFPISACHLKSISLSVIRSPMVWTFCPLPPPLVAMVTGAYGPQGLSLIKFFFLLTFAAAIPAIISGGIAERAKFGTQLLASGVIVALVYPFFEGMIWNGNYGFQAWLEASFGASFHDFAGSVVVHGVGGWIAFSAVILLGARLGRYGPRFGLSAQLHSLAGAWRLAFVHWLVRL